MRKLWLAVVVTACLTTSGCGASGRDAATTTSQAVRAHAIAIDPPVAAPPFRLRDQSGTLIGPQDYQGHWTVVTFLYTHCPDVCPLIANQLVLAQRTAPDLQVVAVSVDPKDDTRAAVSTFLTEHHAGRRFRYVTGTRAALAPVWRKYHIAALPGPASTVSHNAVSILIDRTGRERFLLDSQLTARDVLGAMGRAA